MLRYAKAGAGALVAGLLVLKAALGDGAIAPEEWLDAGIQILVVGFGVGLVPNAKPTPAGTHLAGDGRGHT